MALLHRSLVDNRAGNRLIASVPGWGYRFVATRSRVEEALTVALATVEVLRLRAARCRHCEESLRC